MQLNPNRTFRLLMTIVVAGGMLLGEVRGQGRVIINEFNSEGGCDQFIELLNLGPGRQNIGCYKIITENKSITIPPNTFLEPGQIYLIAGNSTLQSCDGATGRQVNLSWSSSPSIVSGTLTNNRFMTLASGNDSYPLVLTDGNNPPAVLDAVRTKGTLVNMSNVNTREISGTPSCESLLVNLSTLIPDLATYEEADAATGTNGTLSRAANGSCQWEKTTADKRSPGISNFGFSVTPAISVTNSYALNCTATSYTSTLTLNVNYGTNPSYWMSSAYSPNSSFNPTTVLNPNQSFTATTLNYNFPGVNSPGFYSFLFSVTENATCGQIPIRIQVIDPIMTVSPTYTVDCLGGIADLKITNVGATNTMAPFYFPISYAVTGSTSFTATGTATTPDVVRISQIPVGTYTATLTPSSQFACPRAIGFSITTQPLTVLSATVSTTAACSNQTSDGFATLSLTNNDLNLYYPIDFTLNKTNGGVTSFVSTGTFSEQTKTFSGLTSGTYEVILDPQADGCLASSSFTINVSSTDCSLQEILKNFSAKSSGAFIEFNFKLDAGGILKDLYLESSEDGKTFVKVTDITFENKKGFQDISLSIPASQQTFFRLNITDIYNEKLLSPVLRVNTGANMKGLIVYPNPFGDQINLSVNAAKDDTFLVCIMTASGAVVHEEQCKIRKGQNSMQLGTSKLAKGVYFLCTQKVSTGERQVTRVTKQ